MGNMKNEGSSSNSKLSLDESDDKEKIHLALQIAAPRVGLRNWTRRMEAIILINKVR